MNIRMGIAGRSVGSAAGRWAAWSAAVVLVFAAGGCGQGGGSSGKPAAIKLVYMAPGFPLYDQVRIEQGKRFEQSHPGIRTQFQAVAGQGYREKLLTQFAGGSAPDVFFIRDFDLPQFAQKGALRPLDPLIARDPTFQRDDIYPQLQDAYTFGETLYALPGSSSTRVLYYNKRLFDEADVAYPTAEWTWREFLDAARRLTKRDERGIVAQYGASFYLDSADGWLIWILQNGGSLFNAEKTRCIINASESREAIEFVKALSQEHKVVPGLMDQLNQDNYQLFLSQRAAMFIGGRWYTVNFRTATALSWDVAPLPSGEHRATPLDSHGWAISAHTKHPQEAWELVKQLAGPDGVRFVIEVGDSMPTLRSIAQSPYFPVDERYPQEQHNHVFLDAIEYAFSPKQIMHPQIEWYQMSSIINTELDKFLIGQLNAEQALQAVEDRLNVLIDEAGGA